MKIEEYSINGEKIKIPVPECYRDCMTLVQSDVYRKTGRVKSPLSIIVSELNPFKQSLLFLLRLSSYKGWLYPLFRLMYEYTSRRANVQISPKTKIGYGLNLGHAICIVVNYQTIIGNNVNLSQFLNIGTNHENPAIIGNNVWIGPHVCIVENVRVQSESSIGAGAIVTKDVPHKATVAGVPAKVLNYNNPGRYIGHRWPLIDIDGKENNNN